MKEVVAICHCPSCPSHSVHSSSLIVYKLLVEQKKKKTYNESWDKQISKQSNQQILLSFCKFYLDA